MSTTSDATVKGMILSGVRRWFAENHPRDVFDRFLEGLPRDDRTMWSDGLFLATSHLPASLYVNMYDGFQHVWNEAGDARFREAAGAVAFYDLSTVMKVIMLLGTPALVATRIPTVYGRYFSHGEFTLVQPTSEAKLTGELRGADVYGRAGCEGAKGWTAKALTYAGAKDLTIDHVECALAGGHVCRYVYYWK